MRVYISHRGVFEADGHTVTTEYVAEKSFDLQPVGAFLIGGHGMRLTNRSHTLHSWTNQKPLSEKQYLEQLRKRFWLKVDKSSGQGPKGECWIWTASKISKDPAKAYGQISVRKGGLRRPLHAHVVSFYLATGRWPKKGMEICHTCDHPPCVRPLHLWEGTHQQNMNDAQAKGRMPKALPKLSKRIKVIDEFTPLEGKVSPQYIRMLRRRAKGLCIRCDAPLATKNMCLSHALKVREQQRNRLKRKRRYISLTDRILRSNRK